MRLVLALFTMVLAYGVAHAQSTLQQNLTAQKLPTYSGNLSLGYNSNLVEQESSQYRSSLSGDLTLNYRLQGAHLLRGYFGGYKELTQNEEWKPNHGFLAWVNNAFWHRSSKLIVGQQVRLNLPYSKESRVRDTKLAGVSVAPLFMVNLAPSVMFIYLPQGIRNFHTYEQTRLGTSNPEYTFSNLGVLVWSVTDAVYLQGVASHSQSWAYSGRRRDPAYSASGEAGYSFKGGLTLAAGWSNGGVMRRFEQGTDQSFEVFNNKTSTVYSALYWVF